MKTPLFLLAAVSLFSTSLAFAEDICDPNTSFLSPQLRARWCPDSYSSAPPARSASSSRTASNQRKPSTITSSRDEENDSDNGDENDDEEDNKPVAKPISRPAPKARVAQPTPVSAPSPVPETPIDVREEAAAPVAEQAPAHHSPSADVKTLGGSSTGCTPKKLRFSANRYPQVPGASSNIVWGANATDGDHVLNPPYNSNFLRRTKQARDNGLEVFAYFEGPCGDTNGKDDGEKRRCRALHNDFNSKFARGTPDTAMARWKPFTMQQLKLSRKYQIGHCEVDNLDNQVKIPLIPFLQEYKKLFDKGEIYCRLVLKNVSAEEIRTIIKKVAPKPYEAAFISPFAIFEDDNTRKKRALDSAMQTLKGTGSAVIVSTCSDRYGDCFTKDSFMSCGK